MVSDVFELATRSLTLLVDEVSFPPDKADNLTDVGQAAILHVSGTDTICDMELAAPAIRIKVSNPMASQNHNQ